MFAAYLRLLFADCLQELLAKCSLEPFADCSQNCLQHVCRKVFAGKLICIPIANILKMFAMQSQQMFARCLQYVPIILAATIRQKGNLSVRAGANHIEFKDNTIDQSL